MLGEVFRGHTHDFADPLCPVVYCDGRLLTFCRDEGCLGFVAIPIPEEDMDHEA